MRNVLFCGVTEIVISHIARHLASAEHEYTDGVLVASLLPEHELRSPRMVIVRETSGREDGVLAERRYGVNVWAENSTQAEHLAHYVMALIRSIPNGKPITAVDSFSGPVDVESDAGDLFHVDGHVLAQFFFSFRLDVRGTHFHPPPFKNV